MATTGADRYRSWMGRRVVMSMLGVCVVLSCGQPLCAKAFVFHANVLGGDRNCVATFTHGDASLVVTVADLDGGCGATTNTLQTVQCTSTLDADTDVLECQRGCFTTSQDVFWISAPRNPDPVHELFGNPPVSDLVHAVVECNGATVLSTDTTALEMCGM